VGYYEGDPNDHDIEFLVASLFPGGKVYLYIARDVRNSFKNRRRTDPAWLPLMVIPIERERFCGIAGIPKLPCWKSVEWMATNMRSAPIVHEWKSAVLSHIAVMPSDARQSLFHDWLLALDSTAPAPKRLDTSGELMLG
jgi:hypothetical protein